MDLEMEEGMIWEPEHAPTKPVHYLALDTNVFISHLNLIRTIHALLSEIRPSPLILVVPSVAIHELDGLSKSRVQEAVGSPATVGMIARAGNKWLLEANRNRRATGYGALRCQALNERWDPAVRARGKGDDQILDCCLYFAQHGARVSLWTEDQNLSVKAESNDIPTFGNKAMSLHRFFSMTGDEYPEKLWHEVRRLEREPHGHTHHPSPSIVNDDGTKNGHDPSLDMEMEMDGGMELDVDLQHPSQPHDVLGIARDPHRPYHPIQGLIYDPAYQFSLSSHQQEEDQRRYPYLLPAQNNLEPQQSTPVTTPLDTPSTPTPTISPAPTYLDPAPATTNMITTHDHIHTNLEEQLSSHPTHTQSCTQPVFAPSSPIPATSFPINSMPTPVRPAQRTPAPPTRSGLPYRNTDQPLSRSSGYSTPTTLPTIMTPITTTQSRSTTPFMNTIADANTFTNAPTPRPTSRTSARKNDNRPSKILLTSLQLALKPCTLSFISHCPPSHTNSSDTDRSTPTSTPSPPTSTTDILPTLASTLAYLDSVFSKAGEPGNSDTRMHLLQGISASKTIKNYVDYHAPTMASSDLDFKAIVAREYVNGNGNGTRRIRSGEVIDALKELIRVCTKLGIERGDEGVIGDVIDDLRKLA
ncbi:hypothetical protein IAT40_006337 [Kwoniella sp. CBS 6097]